jgi:hypothetical protein
MKHAKHMTQVDVAELAAIEADVVATRKRRARLMGRLRQRAWRESCKPGALAAQSGQGVGDGVQTGGVGL